MRRDVGRKENGEANKQAGTVSRFQDTSSTLSSSPRFLLLSVMDLWIKEPGD
jgi:hypothetical protein